MWIRHRNKFITIFVIFWLILFHYESVRFFYLNPFFETKLPKIKFLFPPAGWIMFYKVGTQYSNVDVYGIKNQKNHLLDPHDILRVRTVGYDNIHRGILNRVSHKNQGPQFCRFLKYRFKNYEDFLVVNNYYPDFINQPETRHSQVQYRCGPNKK